MTDWPPEDQMAVHIAEAAGIVAAQAGCDLDEARGRLIIRAAALGLTLEDMVLDVLDGRACFD